MGIRCSRLRCVTAYSSNVFSVVSCQRSRFRPLTRLMERLQSTVQQPCEGSLNHGGHMVFCHKDHVKQTHRTFATFWPSVSLLHSQSCVDPRWMHLVFSRLRRVTAK